MQLSLEQYMALDMIGGVGVGLTDNLSVGSSLILGNSYLDGPFVDFGGMTPAYALRGSLGANYYLRDPTSLGFYYQTKKNFTFDDAAVFRSGTVSDIKFDHPANVGFGIADSSLLDGRLLLAADMLYKIHSDADFLKAISASVESYWSDWVPPGDSIVEMPNAADGSKLVDRRSS